MLVHNFYFYDKDNTEKFEKHHKNVFQNYYNLVIVLSGKINVITNERTITLTSGSSIIIKPLTFNRVILADEDARCLFIGIIIELPTIYAEEHENPDNNLLFDRLANSMWALTNIGYRIGSDHMLKTLTLRDGIIYPAIHVRFPAVAAENVEKIRIDCYVGAAGKAYLLPAGITPYDIRNAVAEFSVKKSPSYQTFEADAKKFVRDGNISEVIIAYDCKTESQIFFGDVAFIDANGETIKQINAEGTIDDIIFSGILENYQGKIINLNDNPPLHDAIGRFTKYYEVFTEKELSLTSLGLVTEILFLLKHDQPEGMNATGNYYNNIITAVMAYIDDNIREKITLNAIAANCNLSPVYVSQIFKQTIRTPIMTYIRAKKIALARHEILCGAKPYEIYYKYGFEDYSTFYRAFKKTYQVSPSDIDKGKK
ncbi:MAG: AraC family transcriptional regulator [Clostridia bacterium]|nr:AraC family transcriptional regulator [Clostridia bacterium]